MLYGSMICATIEVIGAKREELCSVIRAHSEDMTRQGHPINDIESDIQGVPRQWKADGLTCQHPSLPYSNRAMRPRHLEHTSSHSPGERQGRAYRYARAEHLRRSYFSVLTWCLREPQRGVAHECKGRAKRRATSRRRVVQHL
jgi:hypothetical protein